MMQVWERVGTWKLCGGCGASLAPNTPVLVLIIGRLRKLRCPLCAGPAPPDLPARQVFAAPTVRPVRPDRLPFDGKAAAAGREPGSDD